MSHANRIMSCPPALIPETVGAFYFVFKAATLLGARDALHVVTGGTGCEDYTTDLSGFVSLDGGFGYRDNAK